MPTAAQKQRKEPKYKAFSRFLLNEIESGVFRPGDKLPSERDLAQKYNIAHMTVNKALNGLVSTGHLERMPPAGTFVKEKPARLKTAVVVMDYRSIHAIFPQPLQHAMADSGYVLSTFDLYNVVEQPDFFLDFCTQAKPDLLLIEGYSVFPFELLSKLSENLRVVFLNRFEHELNLPGSYILTDTEQTGRAAMELLAQKGCKKIGIFMGAADSEYHTDLKIVKSATEYLQKSGIQEPVIIGIEEQNEEHLTRLMEKHNVDGAFGIIDSYLVSLVKVAQKAGIRIPEDLALVGRGNTPWADSFSFTSLDLQPGKFISEIKNAISGSEGEEIVTIPVSTVYRESCPLI